MAGFDGRLSRAADKEKRASVKSAKCVRRVESHHHYLRSVASFPGASGEDQSNPEGAWYSNARNNIHFQGDVNNIQIGNNNTMYIHQNKIKCTHTKGTTQTKPDGLKPKKKLSENETRKYEELKACPTEVTQEHMLTLCTKIGKRWRHYGRKLGLSDEDLECIKANNSDNGLREIVYGMLTTWKQKSENVSVGELVSRLTKDGDISVIEDLLKDN
ncbi:hypothetical protein SNE40_015328 [Patella caerulea]|uniref:Death domain-containing protein n=1 Tax=Patella caerulea TaxID=87958 RepID=A0AAN8JGR3_PATCE